MNLGVQGRPQVPTTDYPDVPCTEARVFKDAYVAAGLTSIRRRVAEKASVMFPRVAIQCTATCFAAVFSRPFSAAAAGTNAFRCSWLRAAGYL